MGDNRTYTLEECEEMIPKMRDVSTTYYRGAIQTGCHAFIEFCGLQQKFIDIFSKTNQKGTDPNDCNTHSGKSLNVEEHDIAYLAEKFDCIFGPTLRDERLRKVFFREMGWLE